MAEDYTPQEQAAIVAWHLAKGEVLTARDVMDLTGMATPRRANILLNKLARVLPICPVRKERKETGQPPYEWQDLRVLKNRCPN